MNQSNLIPLQNVNNSQCFGCSDSNSHGLKMKFFRDDSRESVVSFLSIPSHLSGWSNFAHGGVISTVLDEIMSWTVIHRVKKFMLTKSISIDYLKPVLVGSSVKAEGRITLLKNDREVEAEGVIFDENGQALAKSKGSFAVFSMPAARKLGLMSEDILSEFEKFFLADK